ncbi:hypothetical protein KIF24_02640 [Micromonospora sp. Llam7]|uniref:hypothetical protein n=1 Tax=Micromonospora tarapacensis TaxID=2835305 RepID=UPI001C837F4F|nr:hypothetical protein [Micromonospora tarapacensis]MBX7265063.1 hypothetical protein [Micromonospora tarapacensis]
MGRNKSEDIKMSRLSYERRVRELNGGEPRSSGSSSDSDGAELRDQTAQNLDRVRFSEAGNGQSAQWHATPHGQPNEVTYDPSFSYAQPGQPGLTADGSLDHEVGGHEFADRTYQHPDDRDLRGTNMHLPGNDVASEELLASYQRQTQTITENWNEVRDAVPRDRPIARSQDWTNHVNDRIDYVQASPNVHNESVSGDLLNSLRQARLADGPVGNQLRAISQEASVRQQQGGEVQRIGPVQSSSSTRMSAYGNNLAGASGQQKSKGRK